MVLTSSLPQDGHLMGFIFKELRSFVLCQAAGGGSYHLSFAADHAEDEVAKDPGLGGMARRAGIMVRWLTQVRVSGRWNLL